MGGGNRGMHQIKFYFLRRSRPRAPRPTRSPTLNPITKSSTTWQEILDQEQGGVFDVHSGSDLVALDGTTYNGW